MTNKNEKDLESFYNYCSAHPEQRFWQALRNWNQQENINESHIFVGTVGGDELRPVNLRDTFYRE